MTLLVPSTLTDSTCSFFSWQTNRITMMRLIHLLFSPPVSFYAVSSLCTPQIGLLHDYRNPNQHCFVIMLVYSSWQTPSSFISHTHTNKPAKQKVIVVRCVCFIGGALRVLAGTFVPVLVYVCIVYICISVVKCVEEKCVDVKKVCDWDAKSVECSSICKKRTTMALIYS